MLTCFIVSMFQCFNKGGSMRIQKNIVGLLVAVLLVLAACGNAAPATSPGNEPGTGGSAAEPTKAADAPAASGGQVDKSKLASKLSVYNWSDYIAPEVLEAFQAEYGVEVVVDVYDNNEDMIAKVRTGNSGYDISVPSDYAVDIMIKDKMLAPLDKSLLPNLKNIKPANLGLYYDKDNTYSIPYNEGLTGIAYLKSKFPTPPDSWAILFDPAQAETITGQFSMLDDEREVPGAALRFIGASLNDTSPENLKKVEEILKAQKPFVAAYDSSSVARKLASGEIVAGHIYNNGAMQARLGLTGEYPGNPDIGFFMPKEGGTIWQDNVVILADSPNAYTAHVFIDFLMRPDIAAKNAAYLMGISPNAAAEQFLPADMVALYKEGFAPDAEMLKRVEWIVRNDASVAFTDLWTAVKGE
jgi:spermidine/putrescine transport system substrate-binding protein